MSNHPPSRQHASFSGHIGIAREDITPPVGIYARNWGAASHDNADSIHRSLTLTALTIAAGPTGRPLILIDADLGWWRPLDLFGRFQSRLLKELSLDRSELIFALSHTHAAPPLMECDSSLPGSDLLQPWIERVYNATVSAVKSALANVQESVLDWHTGHCALAASRDLPDPESGNSRFVCGFNPEREADNTLVVGRVTSASGELRATLVNYACHPTTLAWENSSISPDYIGAMRQTMEAATGATAIFLQGMSGDVAPRHQYVGQPEVADRHGRQLAFAALATLQDMEPAGQEFCFDRVVESGAPLAVWRHQPFDMPKTLSALEMPAELPLKDWPTAEQLEEERRICTDRALEERLRRKRDIRRALGDGDSFPLSVYVWRMGNAVLVGCPGEAYSRLQVQLRCRFPDLTVICLNLVNGSVGYLPPSEIYDSDVYPVWQTPFACGCFEIMYKTMIEAIRNTQSDSA